MPEILDIIKSRRSIRRFKPDKLEQETLRQLLEAAMAAPTAANGQPWEFIVVTDEDVLDTLQGKMVFGHYHAPAAILVLGSPEAALNPAWKKFWVQDCSAATENILIAAAGMGLGAVWIGVHPVAIFEKRVRKALNIPENVTPLNIIYLGHPDEEKEARTQYEEKRVHWNSYQSGK